MSDYNGWTNYETWRVNLEMINGIDPYEMGWLPDTENSPDLADCLKDYVTEMLCGQGSFNSLALDYALAFIDQVNWREIAEHMLDAYADETQGA